MKTKAQRKAEKQLRRFITEASRHINYRGFPYQTWRLNIRHVPLGKDPYSVSLKQTLKEMRALVKDIQIHWSIHNGHVWEMMKLRHRAVCVLKEWNNGTERLRQTSGKNSKD